ASVVQIADRWVLLLNYQNFELQGYDLGAVIPVELTSFTASVVDGNVSLNWSTASEINNHGFEVERAINRNEFVTIAFVEGYGTTTEAKNYNFTDKNITSGSYIYRLKQVDFDGRFEYSPEVEVDFESAPVSFSLNQNYPNPFNPSTKISFSLPVESDVTLKVFNVIGEEIKNSISGTYGAGVHNLDFDGSGLNSGVYFYSIEAQGTDGSSFSEVKKMLLTK
ncbi:MAG: T9SS C-terminal target domain-containing protein, partial [Ignavibacteriales bacterium]